MINFAGIAVFIEADGIEYPMSVSIQIIIK